MATDLERSAIRYPALFPYGPVAPPRLTPEQEATASFDDRLKSVWMYLAKGVMAHSRKLNPRERANLSIEDAIQGVVEALIERDSKWSPDRGRYITFAGFVMRHALATLKEKAHTLALPSNAMLRLHTYQQLEREGRISKKQSLLLRRMLATLGEAESIDKYDRPSFDADPAAAEQRMEEVRAAEKKVRTILRGLERPAEAFVLSRMHGLGKEAPQTHYEVAKAMPGQPHSRIVLGIARRLHARLEAQAKEEPT